MCPGRVTCIRIHICRRTHVVGYMLLVRDTCWLYLGDIITIHLCHGRLVSLCIPLYAAKQQTGEKWQQFCRRYKKHVDGNKWIQLQVDTTCIRQHVSWCKRGIRLCYCVLQVTCWTHLHGAAFLQGIVIRLQRMHICSSSLSSMFSYSARKTRPPRNSKWTSS